MCLGRQLFTNIHSLNGLGGSFSRFAIYRRGYGGRPNDHGAGGSFVANASTLETDGWYSFVLNGLHQGTDSDFRDKRGVQIHLDVEPGKMTSDIVNGASIYLKEVTQLVSNPMEDGVIVELYGQFRKSRLNSSHGKLSLRRLKSWWPLSDGEELLANEPRTFCHTPNPKGSKAWEIHSKGICRFFLFGKPNYRRSLFSFHFHKIRIYSHKSPHYKSELYNTFTNNN